MQFQLLCMYLNSPFFSYMFIMLSSTCILLNFISYSFPSIWYEIISSSYFNTIILIHFSLFLTCVGISWLQTVAPVSFINNVFVI